MHGRSHPAHHWQLLLFSGRTRFLPLYFGLSVVIQATVLSAKLLFHSKRPLAPSLTPSDPDRPSHRTPSRPVPPPTPRGVTCAESRAAQRWPRRRRRSSGARGPERDGAACGLRAAMEVYIPSFRYEESELERGYTVSRARPAPPARGCDPAG